jgi:hypothetical protein
MAPPRCRQPLATLPAFHVDEPHMIAGVDRNGDYAAAGDRIAFFAESKRG